MPGHTRAGTPLVDTLGMHTGVGTHRAVLIVLTLHIFATTPPPHEAFTEHMGPTELPVSENP